MKYETSQHCQLASSEMHTTGSQKSWHHSLSLCSRSIWLSLPHTSSTTHPSSVTIISVHVPDFTCMKTLDWIVNIVVLGT